MGRCLYSYCYNNNIVNIYTKYVDIIFCNAFDLSRCPKIYLILIYIRTDGAVTYRI